MALLPTAQGPRQPVNVRCRRARKRAPAILRRSHSAAQCSLSKTQRPSSPQPQQQLPLAREQTNRLPTTWTMRNSSPRARTLTAEMPRRSAGVCPPRGSQVPQVQPARWLAPSVSFIVLRVLVGGCGPAAQPAVTRPGAGYIDGL